MVKELHPVLATTMALLMLFSTLSFAVDMHFCGDHLVDLSFTGEADSCGMLLEGSDVETKAIMTDMGCCTDVEITQQGQDDLQLAFDELSVEQQYMVAAFFYSYVNLFEGLEQKLIPYNEYSPPLLIRDVQLLDQTFLI